MAVIVAVFSFGSNVFGYEPPLLSFDTVRIPTSAGQISSVTVYAYNELGVLQASFPATGTGVSSGSGTHLNVFYNDDLAKGVYSFAIDGPGGRYWTDLQNVANGAQCILGVEAFNHTTFPPPQVFDESLLVKGSIEMEGSVFNMGSNPINLSLPAFSLVIEESYVQKNIGSSASTIWEWRTASGGVMSLYADSGSGSPQLTIGGAAGGYVLTTGNAGNLYKPVKLAIGSSVAASGTNSFAVGNSVTASGPYSAALGLGTKAEGDSQFVVGQYNTPVPGNGITDPLFIVGNGQNSSNTSNAFLVSRNGDTRVAGKLIAGNSSLAAGLDATAIGYQANAAGEKAIAIGANTYSGGTYTNVLGIYCQAHGYAATSIGFSSHATGEFALAMGRVSFATGYDSYAIGSYNIASGPGSFAFGGATTSSGLLSTTFGTRTEASGTASVALGDHTKATAYAQFVAGAYNKDSSNALLIIGNGTDADGSGPNAPVRDNAFEVRKDGSVHATVLRVRESGDISMGGFQTGPKPFDP